jgi:hypothetical protein
MYRLLCYGSYALLVCALLAGAIALGAANAAWTHRETWVTWSDGPGWLGLFRPKLFPPEAQPLRRRAARWQVVVLVSLAASVLLAFALSGPAGSAACWR